MRLKLTKTERTKLRAQAKGQGVSTSELVTGMVRRMMSLRGWAFIAETAALLQVIEDTERERDSARTWAVYYEQESAELRDQVAKLKGQPRPATTHVSTAHLLEAERVKARLIQIDESEGSAEERDALLRRRAGLREMGATA